MPLRKALGFGAWRGKRFRDALDAVDRGTADMVEGGTWDMEYTRTKFGERLRMVVGPYYIPREERYQ